MAVAIPAVIVASAAISAFSAIRQGQAAQAAGRFNAEVAQQNAGIVRGETELSLRQQDRENYMRLGAIRAAQGKAGGAAGEGSVLDIIGDVASQGELERQNIIRQGAAKERGFYNTAQLDTMEGRAAMQTGYLRAGSELLSGAGNAGYASNRLARTR